MACWYHPKSPLASTGSASCYHWHGIFWGFTYIFTNLWLFIHQIIGCKDSKTYFSVACSKLHHLCPGWDIGGITCTGKSSEVEVQYNNIVQPSGVIHPGQNYLGKPSLIRWLAAVSRSAPPYRDMAPTSFCVQHQSCRKKCFLWDL